MLHQRMFVFSSGRVFFFFLTDHSAHLDDLLDALILNQSNESKSFFLFSSALKDALKDMKPFFNLNNLQEIVIERGPENSFTNLRIVHSFVNGIQAAFLAKTNSYLPIYQTKFYNFEDLDDLLDNKVFEKLKLIKESHQQKFELSLFLISFFLKKDINCHKAFVKPIYSKSIDQMYKTK
jgi:hypothetical protein